MPEETNDRELKLYPLISALTLALYLLLGGHLALMGDLNQDEGWYLYAARLVYEGKLPYVDFAYFQPPLLPYIYGLPQALLGPGILTGRLTSLALGLATVILTGRLARKLAGDAAAAAGLILCSTSTFVWAFATTRTEPPATFLTVLALYLLLGARAPLLATLAMGAAAGVRLPCLPGALLFAAAAFYKYRGRRKLLALTGALNAAQLAIFFGLPLAAAPQRTIFNLLTSQLGRDVQLEGGRTTPLQLALLRCIQAPAHLSYYFPAALTGALTLAAFAALSGSAVRKRRYLFLFLLALALYLPNFAVPYNFQEVYFVPSCAVLAIAVGCGLADLYHSLRPGPAGALPLALTVSLVATQAASFAQSTWTRYIGQDAPQLAKLRQVAGYVASITPPEKQIVTFNTYIAVEANRPVAEGLEMNTFSLFPNLTDEEARRLRVMNDSLFAEALRDERTGCVLLTDFDLRLLAEHRWRRQQAERPLTEDEIFAKLPALRGYRLVRTIPRFGQWHDNLYVFIRTAGGDDQTRVDAARLAPAAAGHAQTACEEKDDRLVTTPDGKTSRWDEESIEPAIDPRASPEAKERARALLRALEQARPIEDSTARAEMPGGTTCAGDWP